MMRTRSTRSLPAAAALCLALAAGLVAPVPAQESPAPDTDLPVLSIGECVNIALGGSPSLAISQERSYAAGQDVKAAWGSFLPDITLSRTWQKSERTDFDVQQYEYGTEPYSTFDSAGDSTIWLAQTQTPLGLADETINTKYKDWAGSANLNVFSGFSKFSNLSAAKYSKAAADANRDYTRELVVQDVVMAYYNLLRYRGPAGGGHRDPRPDGQGTGEDRDLLPARQRRQERRAAAAGAAGEHPAGRGRGRQHGQEGVRRPGLRHEPAPGRDLPRGSLGAGDRFPGGAGGGPLPGGAGPAPGPAERRVLGRGAAQGRHHRQQQFLAAGRSLRALHALRQRVALPLRRPRTRTTPASATRSTGTSSTACRP